MIYVGIDVAKTTHFAAVMNSDGVVLVEPFAFDNDAPGFSKLISKIASFPQEQIIIGLESTGIYSENLICFLFDIPYSYYANMGALNQAARREGLSAKIRFASANSIFSLAVCFRRPRYRVFRYPNCPFMTANTCSTLALTDDFSCSLLLICPLERLDLFLYCDGLRLIWYLIFFPVCS